MGREPIILKYCTPQPPAPSLCLLPVLPAAAVSPRVPHRDTRGTAVDDTLSASTRALSGGEMQKQPVVRVAE